MQKELLDGNDWNVKREDITINAYHYSPNQVTHPEGVQKAADLQQAYYRWESNLKEFQRGRTIGLDDDVKANAMRHMMPKEILDAVNLQPQYRTFAEIRDYMLQQARQRADVFVRNGCPATKNTVINPSRASMSTNSPSVTKSTPVPMDLSQMSSNAAKSETEDQESDSNQYELDPDGDGDELFAVKGKGKGGFKGTCFKCGMRGHKADRCWQKGKGKGEIGKKEREDRKEREDQKENGQIQDTRGKNSWYHSNWHGKAYGLEVDPWAAVEPVPYLCAVSRTPEFSEPKHVRKGHCTHALKLVNSGTFAHQNRFSILTSDDDENSLSDCDVAEHTTIKNQAWKIRGERNNEFSCCEEPVDACSDLEMKVTCPRTVNAFQSNAHHVSYLAKSEVDNKGVHHVAGSGWRRVSAIMDSGSAECVAPENIARNIPLMETEASRQGQTYHTADGGVIKNKGEKTVTMYSEDGDQFRARYQITDVTRPLNSISRVCDQGNNVLFTKTGGWIINHESGRYTWFPREHGVYVLHSWVNESFPRQECLGSAIPKDTWSQRSL